MSLVSGGCLRAGGEGEEALVPEPVAAGVGEGVVVPLFLLGHVGVVGLDGEGFDVAEPGGDLAGHDSPVVAPQGVQAEGVLGAVVGVQAPES